MNIQERESVGGGQRLLRKLCGQDQAQHEHGQMWHPGWYWDGPGPTGGRVRNGQVGTKTHWTETQSCSASVLSPLMRLGPWTPALLPQPPGSFTLTCRCSPCS